MNKNNELSKMLALILLKIIIRVILVSLGLQLEALRTYESYISNPRTRNSFYSTRSPLLQDKYNDNRIRYTQDIFYNYLYTFTNSYPNCTGNNMY